jgi:hypothetical protein
MKEIFLIAALIFCFGITASAQLPKIPKLEIPKIKTNQSVGTTQSSSNSDDNDDNSVIRQTIPPVTILKPTLTVRAVRDLNYWKQPDAKNFWSWMPKVDFLVTGPIPDASFFTFEFTMPDGRPWFSWDTAPVSVAEGQTFWVESEAVSGWKDKRSTIETGVFGFKITLKNNLQGTAKEMYRGKFKVGKKFAGTAHPDFKNQNAFYVDQDWALPIGYLTLDMRTDQNAPVLNVLMWFRGEFDRSRVQAFLYHNGKQISNTTSNDKGFAAGTKSVITEGDDKREFYWALWNFAFYNTRVYDLSGSNSTAHLLSKNPGNYEVKVLLDGELARTASFTVGSDGKIVDSGIASNNGFSGLGIVIPVKIMPSKEGTLNLQSWKTEAFYGNPLTGFTAQ